MANSYTRAGDQGSTGLCKGGRVKKNHPRVQAYGSVDELNAVIGMAIAFIEWQDVKKKLEKVQNELFIVSTELSRVQDFGPIITEKHVSELENACDECDSELEPLKKFILPGGSREAALLHVCRTVCRRAEREIVQLNELEPINKELLRYMNRLSSLFFQLARVANKRKNVSESNPTY